MTHEIGSAVLRIACVAHLTYVPQFVAEALGYYREMGLPIEFVPPTQSGYGLIVALRRGQADLLVGNPWFAYRFATGPQALRAIAEINHHCRYVLVGRPESRSGAFNWLGLRRKTLIVPVESPPPAWVSLFGALRRQQVPVGEVQLISGFRQVDAIHEFLDGVGDYLLLDVETAQDDRFDEVATLAEVLGPIAWSVYCAPADLIDRRRSELVAFRTALGLGQAWVATHDVNEICDVLADRFAGMSRVARERIVARYKAMGMWATSPAVGLAELRRWQEMVMESGLLRTAVAVEDLAPFDFER